MILRLYGVVAAASGLLLRSDRDGKNKKINPRSLQIEEEESLVKG